MLGINDLKILTILQKLKGDYQLIQQWFNNRNHIGIIVFIVWYPNTEERQCYMTRKHTAGASPTWTENVFLKFISQIFKYLLLWDLRSPPLVYIFEINKKK